MEVFNINFFAVLLPFLELFDHVFSPPPSLLHNNWQFAIVRWSVVATLDCLPLGLLIHQRTKFQFLARLVS